MRNKLLVLCLLSAGLQLKSQNVDNVKTTFQTSREWRPTIDTRADAVMVYGIGGNPSDKSKRISFEERVRSWKDRGYTVHFMTGIAWGEYQDYLRVSGMERCIWMKDRYSKTEIPSGMDIWFPILCRLPII